MFISDIQESNSSNILKWALSNNAQILTDIALIDIINDEMKYLVTIEDVNFLEVYQLTQIYRNQLMIVVKDPLKIADEDLLKSIFGLSSKDDKIIPWKLALQAISKYSNLFFQIEANEDDEHKTPLDLLFMPMINRRFTIQIPLRFIDFIYLLSDAEYKKVFKAGYPNTLEYIIDAESSINNFKGRFMMQLIKNATPTPFNKKIIKYLDITKFKALHQNSKDEKFYTPVLLNFGAEDPMTKKIIRYSFFKANKEDLQVILKKLNKYKINEMMYEFAIQLPIEYMQILENTFHNGIVEIKYRTPMNIIANRGYNYNQILKIRDLDENLVEPIDPYALRINEAAMENIHCINLLELNLNNNLIDTNRADIYSLLPSVYTVQCVIRISSEDIKKIITISNPVIKNIFIEIQKQINLLNNDINKH